MSISRRAVRGVLFVTSVSVLSLHAMAESGMSKPLPSPIFAASPNSAGTEPALAAKPTADRLDPIAMPPVAAVAPPVTATPTGNRMPGFAIPSDTASLTSSPEPLPVTAPVQTLASSRANIPRINNTGRQPLPLHPVAAAYPGHDVIVCVAGCGPTPIAVSVYKPKAKPTVAQGSQIQGGLMLVAMNTSGTSSVAIGPTECVAGCYGNSAPRAREATPNSAAISPPAAVPSPGSPVGATDRSVMVQTAAKPAAAIATPKPKPATAVKAAPKKPAGSEWFTRRFDKQGTN